MTRFPGILRSKLVIADYGRQLAIILIILGILLLGVAGWVYYHPPTTSVTDHTNKQTITTALHTSAIVTGESSLYQQGTRLADKDLYLLPATPDLTLILSTSTPSGEAVHITHRLELVLQATNGGSVFWERSGVLEEEQLTTSNSPANTSTTINVPALEDRLDPIRNEIGSGSSLNVFLRVTTSYETSQYSGTLSETAAMKLSQNSYAVEHVSSKKTESTLQTREIVLPSRDEFAYQLPGIMGMMALLLGVAVGLGSRRLERRDILADQVHSARYTEWISEASLPPTAGNQHVKAASLGELVDIAIDTKKRVVFDSDKDVYAVIDGPTIYYYGDWDLESERNFDWTTG